MNPAIRVDSISKCYRIGQAPAGSLTITENVRAMVASTAQKLKRLVSPAEVNEKEGYWAIKDVSFEVNPGELVGVIGRNGAGKSTLLKLLSRVTVPTKGRIEVRGRMGSLLEVGTGFHAELTGRENIYLNGSILGMRHSEIRKKFDDIVDFSGVGQFLDTPVKRYSSGMYVRLGFAIAAFLEPEILIIDEVLAVGDATFQKRCIDRMLHLAQGGRTILFVSHNMQLIPKLCQRAVLLDKGQVQSIGSAEDVTNEYLQRLIEDTRSGDLRDKPRRGGDGRAKFVRVELVDEAGKPITQFVSGDDMIIRMEIESKETIERVDFAVVLQSLYGQRLITSWTPEIGFRRTLRPGLQVYECRFRNVRLRPGHTVIMDLWMAVAEGHALDFVERVMLIEVAGDNRHTNISTAPDQGLVVHDYDWREVE